MKESLQKNPDKSEPSPDQVGNLEDCQERLRFEILLTNLSARFCAVSPEDVDAEIDRTLRRVCETLGLDLSAVWQRDPSRPETMILTHLYRAIDGPPPPDPMDAIEYHPWAFQQVLTCKTVALSSTEDVPPEAAKDQEVWRKFGIKTCLIIPLVLGDAPPIGAVSFNDLVKERQWTETLISRLQLIAQVFSNAIVRKRKETALRRSEARLKLAADSGGTGLWSLDQNSMRFWITDRARQLFGFEPDDVVTFDGFAKLVHPEDRSLVYETLEKVLKTGEDFNIEYRVLQEDGNVRWMVSRGGLQKPNQGGENPVILGTTIELTERKEAEYKLRQAYDEVKKLRRQLAKENIYLQSQISKKSGQDSLVGESEPVKQMLMLAKHVAPTDTTVLINGETGTGKELLAKIIHELSARHHRALIKVNCAALPGPLIESELFGREKGAFTGAMTRQPGRFEVADGATLMLDEIGELPLELQTKLLRVLEDGTFERLGSVKELSTDVRVIAATNRDLDAMVSSGEFREDLYHRLNVFPISVPPLRDRIEDIPLLVWKLVKDFNVKMGRSIESIPPVTMQKIKDYPWPGNVRELRNVIERAMILSTDRTLNLELPALGGGTESRPSTLKDLECKHILQVLDRVHWRISGKGGAAEILGLVPTTLHSRMKKLGIVRPRS